MTRVFLADDQPEVRSALRLLLEQEPSMVVVGEAAEAEQLHAQMEASCPDLLLLDWELPGFHPVGTPPSLNGIAARATVVVLSGRPEARQEALQAGAAAFVSKGDPPEQLLKEIRSLPR